MDLQRAAGQGETKAQQTHSPRRPLWRPASLGVRFRIALAGRALQVHAPGPGVGFAFGADVGDPPASSSLPSDSPMLPNGLGPNKRPGLEPGLELMQQVFCNLDSL